MSVTSPLHTSIFIVALMVGTGVGAWLLLSQGLARAGVPDQGARRWRWALGVGLVAWFGGRLAVSADPPGADVLATPYSLVSFAFLLGG